jgi:hypothetical protein
MGGFHIFIFALEYAAFLFWPWGGLGLAFLVALMGVTGQKN